MTAIELDNQINILESRIEQMKNHELFNDMEKRDNLSKLNDELEKLQLQKINNIEVITTEGK